MPILPELVSWLRWWIEVHELPPAGLLHRTRTRKMPSPSNWCRSLHRGCRLAGRVNLRVYDARHACATTWLRAGVPLGEVARRLGHSVETLVLVYVGALEGDDREANRRIDSACEDTRAWLAEDDDPAEEPTPRRRRRPRT